MTSGSCLPSPPIDLAEALEGCLLGTAAGDMLGLPFENLSRAHVARLLREPLEQSLFLGRGLVSDDTDVAEAPTTCVAGPAAAGGRRAIHRLAAPRSRGPHEIPRESVARSQIPPAVPGSGDAL